MSLLLNGVKMAFGGFVAVDGVSFEVADGTLVGLIGPNGAGKSTLFAGITGFLPLQEGRVVFQDQELSDLPPHARAQKGIGRSFQVPREFTHLTVRQNLAAAVPGQAGEGVVNLFLRPALVRRQEAAVMEKVERVLKFLNLGRVADLQAGRLSGGQKKLLELGRALLVEPRFVLLDEPFGGVNPVLIDEISTRIRDLNASGIGFLIVEHNLGALTRLVARVLMMDRGQILADGSPKEVLDDPRVREAYMGGRT